MSYWHRLVHTFSIPTGNHKYKAVWYSCPLMKFLLWTPERGHLVVWQMARARVQWSNYRPEIYKNVWVGLILGIMNSDFEEARLNEKLLIDRNSIINSSSSRSSELILMRPEAFRRWNSWSLRLKKRKLHVDSRRKRFINLFISPSSLLSELPSVVVSHSPLLVPLRVIHVTPNSSCVGLSLHSHPFSETQSSLTAHTALFETSPEYAHPITQK